MLSQPFPTEIGKTDDEYFLQTGSCHKRQAFCSDGYIYGTSCFLVLVTTQLATTNLFHVRTSNGFYCSPVFTSYSHCQSLEEALAKCYFKVE